ncbi:hypothetical protein GCM10009037_08740 [Halarchaeum grantii]|uniref:Uncharacterized protein n=2 Tax=Halarchaeum grantii TaxID=1193105 RepID=A0A830ET81_9EURY|nr:hypothetical protein GCM10009037_08740 [Halarchaeum grantii]
MTMNSSRYSSLALAALLALSVLAVPAGAVSVDGTAPPSAQVGSQQTATYTFTDLYEEYDTWTLRGSTELTQVTWTVTLYDQTGAKIAQHSPTGQSFEQQVQASEDVNKVTVRVEGTVPAVEEYSYEPAQQLTVAEFTQAQQGGSASMIGEAHTTRPYTESSQEARTAIEDAQSAIESAQSAGASVSEATSLVENAISAYNAGNFENAISLASQAEQQAESAASSAQTQRWLFIGAGVVVALLVIGGGVWWYLRQRDTYDRLG